MQQIIFEFDTQHGVFRDALWLPDDHGLTDDQIQARKQERLDAWIRVVTNQSAIFAAFANHAAGYVAGLLTEARLSVDDTLVDLGCGDGGVVIQAARDFGARCIGVELDENLATQAQAAVDAAGLSASIEVRQGDIRNADLAGATVVYMYMTPEALEELQPKLQSLPAGTRIVSPHQGFVGWEPSSIVSNEYGVGYIWTC